MWNILIKITIKYSDCQLVESVTINHHVVNHQKTKLVTGLCRAKNGLCSQKENQFCETTPWSMQARIFNGVAVIYLDQRSFLVKGEVHLTANELHVETMGILNVVYLAWIM